MGGSGFRYGDPIVNPKNMTPHDLTQRTDGRQAYILRLGFDHPARDFRPLSMAATK